MTLRPDNSRTDLLLGQPTTDADAVVEKARAEERAQIRVAEIRRSERITVVGIVVVGFVVTGGEALPGLLGLLGMK